jgi:hypothetical protein
MTASITTDELIFMGTRWDELHHPCARGTVGGFIAHRGNPWNTFVIVDDDVENKRLTIITPRIRFFAGQVVLGQDRETDEPIQQDECAGKCTHGSEGRMCVCGAKKRWVEELYQSFRPAWEGEYTTSRMCYDDAREAVRFVTIPLNYLNNMDTNYNHRMLSASNGTRLYMWDKYLIEDPHMEPVITRVQTDDMVTIFMNIKDFECTWKKELSGFSWIFMNTIPGTGMEIVVEESDGDDLRLLMDKTSSASVHLSKDLARIFQTYKEETLTKAARMVG